MSAEEFEETVEIQIEGCCNWEGGYFPVTYYFLVLLAFK